MGRLIPGISDNQEIIAGIVLVVVLLAVGYAMTMSETYRRRRRYRRRRPRRRPRRRRRRGRAFTMPTDGVEGFIRKGDDLERARTWHKKYGFA